MSGSARSGLRKSSARIELEVSEHTLSLVDRARGEFSRGEWIRDAIGAQLSGKRGHLADVTMPSTAPEREGTIWRAGRSVGRTIYLQVGGEPSKADLLIGVMDSGELAARVITDHNGPGAASSTAVEEVSTVEEGRTPLITVIIKGANQRVFGVDDLPDGEYRFAAFPKMVAPR
jgi:hypothetical protein